MKHLVLGGGGFLGSNLARALHQQGVKVRIFDRPNLVRPPILRELDLEWLEGDFIDAQAVAAAVAGVEVVHQLVSTTLPKSSNENPVYDIESNLAGTVRLLEAAVREGVRKVVFSSSGGTVYGIPRYNPIDEEHPTEPLVSYGIAKLAIEKYLHLFSVLHGLDYAVLRISNPYGPGQSPTGSQGALTVFLHRALTGLPIEIWGDGTVVRDYLHVDDVTAAFLKVALEDVPAGVFNVGSGRGTSLNELIGILGEALGRPVAVRYAPGRPFDVPVNVLNVAKAAEVLRWRPQVSLEDGVARMIREHGASGAPPDQPA